MGVTTDPTKTGMADAAETAALVQKFSRPSPVGPQYIVTLGASITNGSSSSNAGTTAYSPMIGNLVSQRRALKGVGFYGYAGQPSAFVASQVQAALAVKPDILIIGPDFGTNSAISSAADVFGSYGQHVIAVARAARIAGVRCAVCMTLPQGIEQATTATHQGIRKQNLWLATVGTKIGLELIDTHSPMLDNTTGYLSTSFYASGADPVHPNDAGHAALAAIIAGWLNENIPLIPWPVGVGVAGLVVNPLMIGAATEGWSATIFPDTFAGTATNTRESRVDVSDLPAGRWHKLNCDATAAGGTRRSGCSSFTVVPGEVLTCFGYIKSEGTGTCSAILWNNSTTADAATIVTTTNGAASVPFAFRYTVPAGTTSLRLAMKLVTTVGQNLSGYMGAMDVIRPSAIGGI